jgi:hypothetical protein
MGSWSGGGEAGRVGAAGDWSLPGAVSRSVVRSSGLIRQASQIRTGVPLGHHFCGLGATRPATPFAPPSSPGCTSVAREEGTERRTSGPVPGQIRRQRTDEAG